MANRYWVGGTANWDGTAGSKWALTSGGAGGQAVPTNADDVFFDAASGTNTVTVSASSRACRHLNFTGFTGTFAGSSTITDMKGSLTAGAGMTWTYSGTVTFTATDSQTITANGIVLNGSKSFNGAGGTWTLQDNVSFNTGTLTLTAGTFTANNKNVTCRDVSSSNSNTRVLNMGSGTWTLSRSNGAIFSNATATNFTVNAGTSTIKWTGTGTSSPFFSGMWTNNATDGGFTFNNLWLVGDGTSANGYFILDGSSKTFANIKCEPNITLRFQDGTTTTCTSVTMDGTSGNPITLTGTSTGGWTISDASGTNTVQYCSISYSTASGGAIWLAPTDLGNVNNGNNSGWNFSPLSSFVPSPMMQMMGVTGGLM